MSRKALAQTPLFSSIAAYAPLRAYGKGSKLVEKEGVLPPPPLPGFFFHGEEGRGRREGSNSDGSVAPARSAGCWRA